MMSVHKLRSFPNMHTELSPGSESNLVAYYNFNEGTGTNTMITVVIQIMEL